MKTELELFIQKAAVENALKFEGKANPKALIGKVVGAFSQTKNDMPALVSQITKIVSHINQLSTSEQEALLAQLGGPSEKKKKSEGLKELTDAKPGNVIMRFAPSPSGPMHIGHAITGGLTSAYVQKYGGKFIFRIEDTNSENIYEPAYDMLVEDANWLFENVHEVIIQSQRMELYYTYAKKLLESNHLYVDTSSSEEFAICAEKQIDPQSKSLPASQHLKLFEQMLDGTIKQGEAVVRFKGDMKHKNPAMRDFPLFRIQETPHPKTKTTYRVWPLMNFSVFVDDVELGMTHIIRAKDHADNAKRQELLYEAIGKKPPISYFTGRYKFTDLELSSTKTKQKIEEGIYSGWDDIRLPTIRSLQRRGFQPQAFLAFTKGVGLTSVDKVVDKQEFFKNIESYNVQIIDPIAKRFFFIQEPIQLPVSLSQTVELDIHPQKHKGGRTLTVSDSVYIESKDEHLFQKGIVRLIDFCNISKEGVHSQTYEDYKSVDVKAGIIHWLPADESQLTTISVHMPDGSIVSGLCEKHIETITIGDIVQFERFGFCRLDSIQDGVYTFWFTQ